MSEPLDFDLVYDYSLYVIGITVPVTMFLGGQVAEFDAKIDTGSTYCVFQRLHAELLGLDVEAGVRIELSTPTGSFRAYGHEVSLDVLGIETVSTVYFGESEMFDRNILGRIGWLDRVKLGLIDAEAKLFLSQYPR
ncbi:MAG: hypothetical protein AB7F88_09780 [Pyrinomonadaceae bacterium]